MFLPTIAELLGKDFLFLFVLLLLSCLFFYESANPCGFALMQKNQKIKT